MRALHIVLLLLLLFAPAGCESPGAHPLQPPRAGTPAPSESPSPSPSPPGAPGLNGSREEDPKKTVQNFWKRARETVYKSPEELKAQHKREKRKGILYAKLMHGDYRRREVALTFDDGPHREYTPQLLKILKRCKIKATFFVVGKMAEKNSDLLRQQYQEGHCIANHSYRHVDLTKIPDRDVEVEWLACNEVIKHILGIRAKYCRPPGGNYDDPVIHAAMKYGLITILWTDDPGDYQEPGRDVIADRILSSIYNGGIILLHDGIQQTINILPGIIEHLKKQGYTFITIDQMVRQKGAEIEWQ